MTAVPKARSDPKRLVVTLFLVAFAASLALLRLGPRVGEPVGWGEERLIAPMQLTRFQVIRTLGAIQFLCSLAGASLLGRSIWRRSR